MARPVLIWAALATAVLVPLAVAATSPLLAWRGPVYIAAGFAGIAGLGLLLVQPLLAGGHLPGLSGRAGRRWHARVGGGIVAVVLVHVLGLWVTSPPDVIDVLLFRSPTPFSDWGAIAMWAVFAVALLAGLRQRLHLRPALWRFWHMLLITVVVVCTTVHALLIHGTMETITKAVLCAFVILATAKAIYDVKPWGLFRRSRS